MIEVSEDKSTWTDVDTPETRRRASGNRLSFTNLRGKYIRWLFRNPNGDPVIGGLAEVEVLRARRLHRQQRADVDPYANCHPNRRSQPDRIARAGPDRDADPGRDVNAAAGCRHTGRLRHRAGHRPGLNETLGRVRTGSHGDCDQGERGPTPYPVIQTSHSASTVSGTLAVDNDPGTVWGTDATAHPGRTAMLKLDFGRPVEVGQVQNLPGPDGLLGTATIETSTDGTTWDFYADIDPSQIDPDGRILIEPGPDVATPHRPLPPNRLHQPERGPAPRRHSRIAVLL